MVLFLIWIGATLLMFKFGPAVGLGAGVVFGMASTFVQASRHQDRLRAAEQRWGDEYRAVPDGTGDVDMPSAKIGKQVGEILGHDLVGAGVGAALDIYRDHMKTSVFDSKQRALYYEIAGLRSGTPWDCFKVYVPWLLLSAGLAWFLQQLF